jgi:hypothetical protein
MKPQRMMEFLDTSIVNPGANDSFRLNDELAKREDGNEKDQTLSREVKEMRFNFVLIECFAFLFYVNLTFAQK